MEEEGSREEQAAAYGEAACVPLVASQSLQLQQEEAEGQVKIEFPDGREGVCGLADWHFWELVDVARLGAVSITLHVKLKDGNVWRTLDIPILDVAEFSTRYDLGQLVLFKEEEHARTS